MNKSGLLLVDDEENIIRSLSRLFRTQGYRILTATSGAEALAVLEREPVAVILSDQRMPSMVGSELFKTVKLLYPETIRIIMSGYTELESITSAINDGAIYKFLLKPWDDEKLLAHIRDAFIHYELRTQNQELTNQIKQLNIKLQERVTEEETKNSVHTRSLLLAQQLLNKIPIAVFGVSDNGLIVMANEHAHQLLGREDLIGNTADRLFPDTINHLLINGVTEKIQTEWPSLKRIATLTPIHNNDAQCICVSVN